MPELPEVESLSRELDSAFQQNQHKIRQIHCLRPDLRFPMPLGELESLSGLSIRSVHRRAKYLLFQISEGKSVQFLISHLGMTGSWRFGSRASEKKHDHLAIEFKDDQFLIYNDPRRFGFVDVLKNIESSKWFSHLGLEPFDPKLSAQHLAALAQSSTVAIKVWLMDQKHIVGVGNIYASEALFRAGIHPATPAKKIRLKDWNKIILGIREVLGQAIENGGTTLKDYRSLTGNSGRFQKLLQVYDQQGQACVRCNKLIQSKTMGGRSTYWCPKCQKRNS